MAFAKLLIEISAPTLGVKRGKHHIVGSTYLRYFKYGCYSACPVHVLILPVALAERERDLAPLHRESLRQNRIFLSCWSLLHFSVVT